MEKISEKRQNGAEIPDLYRILNDILASKKSRKNIPNTVEKINYDVILAGYSEIALKSNRVQKRLFSRIISHIGFKCKRKGIKVESMWHDHGRIYIKVPPTYIRDVIRIMLKTFGIYTVSPALMTEADIRFIKDKVDILASNLLFPECTFGVRARRTGDVKYRSRDIERWVGGMILSKYSHLNLKVDLDNPDIWFNIEVRNKRAYLYSEKLYSLWTGNPIESTRGVIVPVRPSSPISDIVAGFMAAKRGLFMLPVFLLPQESGDIAENIIEKICAILSEYFPVNNFYYAASSVSVLYKLAGLIVSEKFQKTLEKYTEVVPVSIPEKFNSLIEDALLIYLTLIFIRVLPAILSEINPAEYSNLRNSSHIKRRRGNVPIKFGVASFGRSHELLPYSDPLLPVYVYSTPIPTYYAATAFSDKQLETLVSFIDEQLPSLVFRLKRGEPAYDTPENDTLNFLKYISEIKRITDDLLIFYIKNGKSENEDNNIDKSLFDSAVNLRNILIDFISENFSFKYSISGG